MIRNKVAPVLWLMLAAVLIGASVGLAARAHSMSMRQPSIGCAAGLSMINGGVGGQR